MQIHNILKQNIDKRSQDFVLNNVKGLNLPNALLIIPDGNGRWAKKMGLSISEGHKAGGKTLSEVLDNFMRVDIKVLGIWAFSEDNWKRPKEEINKIMEVIETVAKLNSDKLIKNNIKFDVLGKKERIKKEYPSVYKTIETLINKTSKNNLKTLVLFIDYGERYQLEEFAKEREKDKTISTYELLSKINNNLPLFDMVLRTSGEQRLSGFGPLVSLAEFVSVKDNLPELTDKDIIVALREFSNRQRRFGGR